MKLQVDASKSGLGAVLIQSDMPVAYASRSLTPAETRYAQIEKELLAVVFGCNRFYQYIYGKQIIVESDHQPLQAITKKPLDKSPIRLQRMLLNLQSYDMEIKYRPGKELYLADTLSRAHLPNSKSEEETLELDFQAISMISTLPVSDDKLKEIKEETRKDETMQTLVKIINEGWPSHKDHLPSSLKPLWNYRDELTEVEGVVFKSDKIFIPSSLRENILQKTHQSHMGIERSKQRARELVFWPGINKDIESVVKKCSVCAEYRCNNQKEPMLLSEIPKYPWQIVATDMFFWNGDDYLLVVDYYSRFWEIFKVSSTKSSAIITKMKTLFARHGIPEVLKSDNGPQYSSGDFAEFAKTWGFKHVTSSPLYPKSNGLAERTVRTAKSILTKARKDHQDPHLALLEHRNTPINDVGSPARLSMGRRLRSKMPSSTEQLLPQTVNPAMVQMKLEQKQVQQKKYYDRSSKPLDNLSDGDDVYVQRDGKWQPAVIMSKADTPRSFNIMTEDGAQYRRNRVHLRKTYDRVAQTSPPEKSAKSPFKEEIKANSPIRNEQLQQHETTEVNHETLSSTGGTASPVKTRSGRIIRKPVRYKDYI